MSYIGKTPEATGSVPLMAVFWFPLRSALPVGFVAADGQTLLRDTFPDAWNEVNNSRVPIVTDAQWNSDVTLRGSFTTGDGSTTFRIPDYNGKSSGSLGAVFLRGDGTMSSGVNGKIQQDALQDHGHLMGYGSSAGTDGMLNASNATTSATVAVRNAIANSTAPSARINTSETRPLNVTGCYAVKLFGAVTTQAMLDTSNVASNVSLLLTRRPLSYNKSVAGPAVTLNAANGVAIPTWVNEITLTYRNVSTTSYGNYSIQLSSGGVFVSSGYTSSVGILGTGGVISTVSSVTEFRLGIGSPAAVVNGVLRLVRHSGNTWSLGGSLAGVEGSNIYVLTCNGYVTLSGDLDGILLSNGIPVDSNTFDSGDVSIRMIA